MKLPRPNTLFARLVLVAVLSLVLRGQAEAQSVTTLLDLASPLPVNATPPNQAGLIQGSDGYFYGVTPNGGAFQKGTVFKMSPQGAMTVLHTFGDGSVTSDGAAPQASLVEGADHNFYGTTTGGGSASSGTVFKITPQGQVTILYSFPIYYNGPSTYQGIPQAALIQGTDGNFYGTTSGIISFFSPFGSFTSDIGHGVVFKITPQGQFTVLHTFADGSVINDGEDPLAALVQGSDGNFYGTTSHGGAAPAASGVGVGGAVFKMTPAGTVTILHSFIAGSDGQNPEAPLIQGSDGNFYGTTASGGAANSGTIFKMTPQGTVTILHAFADGGAANDGYSPQAALVLGADGNFYGTTSSGGDGFNGTIFEITPQSKYSVLHNFNDGSTQNDGANCEAPLVLGSDGNLYGTTESGGPSFEGTAFVVMLNLPALTSSPELGGNVDVPFTSTITASQSTTNIAVTTLPDGLVFDPATGIISGTPTTVEFFPVTVTLTNAFGSSVVQLSFNIEALPVPVVSSILTAYGTTNTPFSYTITATNGASSFTASPLPPGLMFESTTGIFSGSPTTPGTYPVSITASNGSGPSETETLTIQVLSGTPTLSQEYVVLHQFNDGNIPSEGQYPSTIFQGFNGDLFGATQAGGTGTDGTVFDITTQGLALNPVSLGPNSSLAGSSTAARTAVGLVQASNGNFYGTAQNVGASTGGYFYEVTPLGTVTILHHFGDGSITNDGVSPVPGIIQGLDGNFYGTTEFGGSANEGCVYRITAQGGVTILHSFGDGSVTNDGQFPTSGLIQGTDGNFYGMTFAGGSTTANAGTVFKITLQGQTTGQLTTQVTILHSFGDGTVSDDGGQPDASLYQGDDGSFYGTTPIGGSFDSGCVFKITTAGAVTILHSFGDGTVTNDGDTPQSPLIEGYDGNFYGTTSLGGSAGQGTLFSITRTGSLTILHSFGDGTVTSDGAYPTSICQALDGNFYGTTQVGGFGNGFGTVFAILAGQRPVHAPIFVGSAFAASALNAPFSYTPKAEFGVSGSGAEQSSAIPGRSKQLVGQVIKPNFGPTNWTISGTLPNTLTFDDTSGTISGTPIESGTFQVTLTANNSFGDGQPQVITLYIDVPPLITSPGTAGGNKLTLFSYTITADALPNEFGATGLPAWLSVDTASGQLSGTPPTGGIFTFNAVAANYAGTSTQKVVLTVTGGSAGAPAITSPSTFNGAAGASLDYPIQATLSPTAYTALNLPVGLTCDPVLGIISGTPTTAGTYSVPITATNSSGTTAAEITFTIAAAGSPVINGPLTVPIYQNIPFSYYIPATGAVSVFSAVGLPNGVHFNPLTGLISGTLSALGTTSAQVFAMNGTGTASAALSLNVVTPTPQTYAQWAMLHSPTGSPTDTPKDDGVPNFLKYLYDLDPNQPVTANDVNALPTLGLDSTSTPNTTYLTLTYRQFELATNVSVHLQTSSDLQTWTTVPPDIYQPIGTDPQTGDPIMEIGVISNGTSHQFIRLDVTSP